MPGDVSVILVTHNSAEVISGALASVAEDHFAHEIFAVDNASADRTCAIIARDFPGVHLIRNRTNIGFGAANNLALEQVKTRYALLLNPDARMERNALSELLAAAERHPNAAILAPLLSHDCGRLQESYKRNVFARERGGGKFLPPEGDLSAEYLSGAVWLLNMEPVRKTGFFDPRFFLFYEDDDLCLRMRESKHDLVLAHGARAFHAMGRSSPVTTSSITFKQYHMMRSRLLLEEKYRGLAAARRLAIAQAFRCLMKYAAYVICARREKTARYKARLRAAREFLAPDFRMDTRPVV